MIKKTAKTGAQRQAELEARKRQAGQVQVKEWVFVLDAPRLKLYAAKLRKGRALADLDQQ